MSNDWPPRLRSALFVPAHRGDFLIRAMESGADALILDLEDSVGEHSRDHAREQVRALTATARTKPPLLCVRINALAAGVLAADLAAAVGPGLLAVVLPKAAGEEDIATLAAALTDRERSAGLPIGQIRIWPLIENASAVVAAGRLAASSPRIAYLGGGTSPGGDLAASVGFEWTPGGLETLFLRSKVLLDARAAGVPHPVTGVVTDLHDPAVLQRFAEQSRQLGYEGMMVIHPSHVAPVNAIFGVGQADRDRAGSLLAALAEAELRGDGAVTHEGRMVDCAMRSSAERLLQRDSEQALGSDAQNGHDA